jgi:hypothetical protein
MTRRRHCDLDAIPKSLLIECPACHYMIPPADLCRPGDKFHFAGGIFRDTREMRFCNSWRSPRRMSVKSTQLHPSCIVKAVYCLKFPLPIGSKSSCTLPRSTSQMILSVSTHSTPTCPWCRVCGFPIHTTRNRAPARFPLYCYQLTFEALWGQLCSMDCSQRIRSKVFGLTGEDGAP